MVEKPMTAEMFFEENLKRFMEKLLELGKEPLDIQKGVFEKFGDYFKKLSRDDQEVWRSILDSIIKEWYPEEVC